MATVRFITHTEKKGKLAPIYVRMRDGKVDIEITSPFKIYPEYWSNKTSSAKQRVVFDEIFTEKELKDLEEALRKLKDRILIAYNECKSNNVCVNRVWLNEIINKPLNEYKEAENLNQYIERFISEAESGERLYDHNRKIKRYEKGSIKNFKGFKTQFDDYQKDKRVKLNFDSITIDFYDEFVKHFTKKNYSVNTIGRHVKNLKSIMRCAREEGLHNNLEIERKKFKVLKTQVENIYLTELELNKMKAVDLTNMPLLEQTRDIFLIGVYTAQRFSDFSKIREAHVKKLDSGIKVIDLIQQKTGERVIIPIRPELDEILMKYGYNVPKIYEQKLNERIKQVGEKAGITETIIIEENKGGFTVKKDVSKKELIKTHTARRTGCTLMYLAGVPTLDIMKISGHKTEREFLNYIKVGKEETAVNLSKHPYFMGSHLKIAK